MNAYRAIQFTRKEQAELSVLERDSRPLGADEIEGRSLYSLISPGTEVVGLYAATHVDLTDQSFPMKPGYAAVFRVEAVGGAVKGFKPGDIVLSPAPHQSFQRVKHWDAVLVPDGLAPEIALFARFAKVSMPTYVRTQIRPPERAIITGLGIVGLMAAQIGQLYGYEVAACDPSESRRELARQHGIASVFAKVPDPAEKPGQQRAGLAIDCSGHERAVLDLCHALRDQGEVFLIGVPWIAKTDLLAQRILHVVFYKFLALHSGWEARPSPTPHQGNYQLAHAMRWLAEGRLRVVRSAYEIVPPTDPQVQYQDILHNRMKTLSVIFDWREV